MADGTNTNTYSRTVVPALPGFRAIHCIGGPPGDEGEIEFIETPLVAWLVEVWPLDPNLGDEEHRVFVRPIGPSGTVDDRVLTSAVVEPSGRVYQTGGEMQWDDVGDFIKHCEESWFEEREEQRMASQGSDQPSD